MFRKPLLLALLLSTAGSFACEADVLRLNYRKTTTSKPAVKAPVAAPKSGTTLRQTASPAASLTASTMLGPR